MLTVNHINLKIIIALLFCLLLLPLSTVEAKNYSGKRILLIDSYHKGYPWSDGVIKGAREVLDQSGADIKIIHMDTKRNKGDEFSTQAALQAKAVIEDFKPDVVIACDDNAAKYLIAKHYKDAKLPFVFCGINWDASAYGFPYKNVTGMLEVTSVEELVDLLRTFAKGNRIGFLAEDSETDRKEGKIYKDIFKERFQDVYVKTFDEWKQAYLDFQKSADILIHYNFGTLTAWDDKAAAQFVEKNARIPSGAFKEDMMSHSMLGYLKVPEEQGIWSAKTALRILDGTPPSSIAIVKNKQGNIILNARIAQKVNADIPFELFQSAIKVIE